MTRLPPALRAAVAHVVAAAAIFAIAYAMKTFAGEPLPILFAALAQGMLAAGLGSRLGLAGWWLPIQLLFAPALVLGLALPIAPEIFLGVFAALLLVYWNSFGGRVPLYLTGPQTVAVLEGLLPKRPGLKVIDLGCGLAGPLIALAAKRPDAEFVGIESAPIPFLVAWARTRASGKTNIEIRFGNLFKTDLAPFDVVYAFLSPEPMPALWTKAKAELRPGTQFISNSFEVPGVKPDAIKEVGDLRGTKVFVYAGVIKANTNSFRKPRRF